MIKAYWQLMRFDKPVGTLLLLWPTLWALWLASSGQPSTVLVVIFVLGVIIMRAAGCIMNDLADRALDRKVWRTRERPLANGTLSVLQASLALWLCLVAAGTLLLFLNVESVIMACVAVSLAAIYPWMKRVTHFPQVVLGLAFNSGILMAFTAVQHTIPGVAWLLYAIGCTWTIAYDTIYALLDKKDDVRAGIKSTALYFGDQTWQMVITLFTIVILGFIGLGFVMMWPWWYFLTLLLPSYGMWYQCHLCSIETPQTVMRAFKCNQGIGLCLFFSIVLALMA